MLIPLILALACDTCAPNVEPSPSPSPAITAPHIVFVLVDDLALTDLPTYGGTKYLTPNIDRLVNEGVKFTQAYAQPLCSASRAALLTGRHPKRSGVTGVLGAGSPNGLPEIEVTVADTLHAAGYETGCFGKWHVGWAQAYMRPTQNGCEKASFTPYSHDMSPFRWWEQDTEVENVADQAGMKAARSLLTTRETQAATDFLDSHDPTRPLFLYLAYSAVHAPNLASSYLIVGPGTKKESGPVAQMRELDEGIGHVLDHLPTDRPTLLIFASDNGGPHGNLPLRGQKSTYFEGGIRIPMIAWGLGLQPRVEAAPVSTLDMLTTLTLLGGGTVPNDRAIDGEDLLPLLLQAGPRIGGDNFWWAGASREGCMKFVRAGDDTPIDLLFDLCLDPYEANPLNDPTTLAGMKARHLTNTPTKGLN